MYLFTTAVVIILLTLILFYTIKNGRLALRFYKQAGMVLQEDALEEEIDEELEEVMVATKFKPYEKEE